MQHRICVLMFVLFAAISFSAHAKSIMLTTPSGYQARAEVHLAKGEVKGVVIMLHGKTSRPGVSHYSYFYRTLKKNGYTVIAPRMPWSRFDGTREQGVEIINAAVAEAAKTSNKIVIAGHSLGAAVALQYLADSPAPRITGGVPIALGHVPQLSGKISRITGASVLKARKLVAAGKGDKKKSFSDFNMGRKGSIYTTANIYLTYYDPQKYPDVEEEVKNIKIPVLWIAGLDDRLTEVYNTSYLFSLIPANLKSQYHEGKGDHTGVLGKQVPLVVEWLNAL